MRRLVLSLLMGALCHTMSAQYDFNDYYQNNKGAEDAHAQEIIPESELFLRPLTPRIDLFTRMSDFNFSGVRYSRRGYGSLETKYLLDNIDLSSRLSSYSNYSLINALRRAKLDETAGSNAVTSSHKLGGRVEVRSFSSSAESVSNRYSGSLYLADRRGRGGGSVNVSNNTRKLGYAVSLWGRWGEDTHIKGVFSSQMSFYGSASYHITDQHAVSLSVAGGVEKNGLRSYATKELFDLTGDKLYNPSWGDYGGKKRNSRVAERFQPLTVVSYSAKIGTNTKLIASCAYKFGENSSSGFAWFRAEPPYPDYYRYLPSYAENPLAAAIIDQQWRQNENGIQQISWDRLYDANNNREEGAAYILEERVENLREMQAAVGGRTEMGRVGVIAYGVRIRMDRSNLFKRAKDLLGGKPFDDVDQFLNDYPYYTMKNNDARNPDKKVGKGDRFGYNYDMNIESYELHMHYEHRGRRYKVSIGGELGEVAYQRKGRYEKELFTGALSYGNSKKTSFNEYIISAEGEYYFAANHNIALQLLHQKKAPYYGTVFLSPRYSNTIVDYSTESSKSLIDLRYNFTANNFALSANGYLISTKDEAAIYSYYDDISSIYSNMIVRGIDKQYYGAELALQYDFSPRWRASLVGAVARSKYGSDNRVDIVEDATQLPYVVGASAQMDGFRCGGSPEVVVSGEVRYSNRGWLTTLTCSYMGERFVEPNPLWRMERAYSLASSTENYHEFVDQQKLSDVTVLKLFLLKSFDIGTSRLVAIVSIDNLLNNKNIVYSGYEQMRIMRRGRGATQGFRPFDRKYLYNYGRTYYASINYYF